MSFIVYAQSELDKELIMLYQMKTYDYSLNDTRQSKHGGSYGQTFAYLFVHDFYESDYNEVANNEFRRDDFLRMKYREATEKLAKLKYDELFKTSLEVKFGAYDFIDNSFPIYFEESDFPVFIVDKIINFNEYDFSLPMSREIATSFIDNRSGGYNRSICLEFIYNITDIRSSFDRRIYNSAYTAIDYLNAYVHHINVYSDCEQYEFLYQIKPNHNYADYISGHKAISYIDTIYRDADWNVTSPNRAIWYNVVQYDDKELVNPVRTYYMSGKLMSEIGYKTHWPRETLKADGEAKWYYESGSIKELAIIENGLWNGISHQFWENGQIKRTVNYKNGKYDGCIEYSDENGDCYYPDNSEYFDSYVDDKKDSKTKCHCYLTKDFWPVKNGGYWDFSVNYYLASEGKGTATYSRTIQQDVVIQGKTYYKVNESFTGLPTTNNSRTYYWRKSDEGIYMIDGTDDDDAEYLYMKLPLEDGANWSVEGKNGITNYRLEGIEQKTIQGKEYKCFKISWRMGLAYGERYLSKDIGIVGETYNGNGISLAMGILKHNF